MRDTFPGYVRASESKIKEIWSKAWFCFDANVLLNVYRYSDDTASEVLETIKKLRPNIWWPWQAALEFHENRLEVIYEQTKAYKETAETVDQLSRKLEHKREHPFINDPTLSTEVQGALGKLKTHLDVTANARRQLLREDSRLTEIHAIFHGAVGTQPTTPEYDAAVADAKSRCERKTPPGFRDAKKQGDRAYGDVFIWRQLMAKANSDKRPVVFVTDDTKDDWWLKKGGEVLGPLPELVQEFTRTTSMEFLLYRPVRFTEYAAQFLGSTMAPDVLKEIQERSDSESFKRRKMRRNRRIESPAAEIAVHAALHEKDIEKFLAAVARVPDAQWQSIKSSFEIPIEARDEMERSLRRCRCIHEITRELRRLSPEQLEVGISSCADELEAGLASALRRLRNLPSGVVEFVDTLDARFDRNNGEKR
jgi:hypothetical protein